MNKNGIQYHIGLKEGDVGRYVLLPGDPKRAQKIAEHFDNPQKIAENREFVTYTGTLEGVKVSVTSTGIGGPSSAICIEELHHIGVDTMIRVGTSGSLQPSVHIGDLVIATGAVRDEGTSRQYIDLAYPAVANFHVTQALQQAAQKNGFPHHLGLVHCKDAFFAEEPDNMPIATELKNRWTMWEKGNVLATEMEGSTLFVLGGIRKIRTGEVVAVIGETRDGKVTIKKVGIDKAIQTAIDALKILIRQDQKQ